MLRRILAAIAVGVPAATLPLIGGCTSPPERSPLSAEQLAPFVGTYACSITTAHPRAGRVPGPRGTLVIRPDGSYTRADAGGAKSFTGVVTSSASPSYDGEREILFSGAMHWMRFNATRRSLRVVYKSMSAFECVRDLDHP